MVFILLSRAYKKPPSWGLFRDADGHASYQLKEIIDNTIAEFEKNKLKNFYE